MSSQTAIDIAIISTQLNSVVLYVLLMGMYTMVFIWTLHIYFTRKEDRNPLITLTLVLLYVNTVVDLGIQWQFVKNAFVDNGETRLSILTALTSTQPVLILIGTVIQFLGYILADGLLVWRCFHVTSRSFLSISVPLFFYFCVIAISIVSLTFAGLNSFNPSKLPSSISGNALEIIAGGSFVYVVDSAASASATFIIFYRISKSLRVSHMPGQAKYKRIIRIIIETAVIYSLSSLLVAIVALVNVFSDNPRAELQTSEGINYLLPINAVATGLAPTIMVAQISLASSRASTKTDSTTSAYQISALEFHHQQTANTTYLRNDPQYHVSTTVKEPEDIGDAEK